MTRELTTDEKIDVLLARIDNLESEVLYLRKRLEKYENPKNSKNSSKPPSSDFPRQQKTQSLREPSDKKPGGQSGHEGTTLKCLSPDFIENHSPSYCNCCGEDLSAQPEFYVGKRQVIDIPPIIPVVTEHQLFERRCTCGHLNRSSYPLGVTAPVSYGGNVQSLISYLSIRQYLPVKRSAEFLKDVFNLPISTGGIDYVLNKVIKKAMVAYEFIRQNVLQNNVIGADETGVNINGQNNWAWTYQHPKATYIAINPNRGFNAIEQIMPEGFQNNVLVTDCWASYFKTDAGSHQLCTAHLLRELTYLKQRYKNDTWAERMSDLIIQSLNLRKTDCITKNDVDEIMNKFMDLLNEPVNEDLNELKTFRKRMVKYANHVFYFLLHKDVPPDNNGSERAIRNFKIKLKVSGFFKSIEGAKGYAVIRSVIDTAIKNDQNPLQIIKLIAQC